MRLPKLRTVGAAAGLLLLAIQLVPVSRANPPVTARFEVDPTVDAALRRACYDCHSNETRWPWYSHVAPMSWLVAYDVEEGREHLNFSTLGAESAKRQRHVLAEACEEAQEGEMAPWFYVALHPEAELTATELAALREASGTPVDSD